MQSTPRPGLANTVPHSTDRLGRVRRLPPHTRYLTAFGETCHLSEWSRRAGVAVPTLIRRLAKGWSIEDAVTPGDGRVAHRHAARGAPSPEYRVWTSMVQRCENPARSCYASYGGRGIRVYPAWRLSFEAFLADVGPRPAGTSLDRIDNDGNYEPGNVRWATQVQQANNARSNVLVTYRGETRTRAEWARRLGISYWTLRQRLDKGWPPERAFSRPVGRHVEES